jgi:hypothetical protein
MLTSLLLLAAQVSPLPGAGSAPPAGSLRVSLLDNGSFAEAPITVHDAQGQVPLAWWRAARPQEQLENAEGRPCLRTAQGEWAEQPLAAYAPLIGAGTLRGELLGKGRVVIVEGTGTRHVFEFDHPSWRRFELPLSAEWVPRLLVRLEGLDAGGARWRGLAAEVALPCPKESELAEEIAQLLERIVEPWLERALDQRGPRNSGFVAHVIDALSGERVLDIPGGFHPLWEQLWHAERAHPHPRWRAALARFLDDWLTLGLHPATGLPCSFDPGRDERIEDRPVEIALALSFLIDLAQAENEPFAPRARAAAIRIGETVLAGGILPDGSVGASYFPADGRVNTGVVSLRAFDVPAQLARLTQLTGDPRYARAAGEALASFEFTHSWAGTWDRIDPAFDDEYGHFGARAVTIAQAVPQDPLYRRFSADSFAHFAPLWRDALRLGGNVAADQVRCWVLLAEQQRYDEANRAEILGLLGHALRSHFKGQQYGDGAWGDVTIFQFDPNSNLQVGDYSGAPQNLLHGIAALYALPEFRNDETRAMYTAVLRSSVTAYLRPYGFLMERREREGINPAAGTLRMMLGLSKMLRTLGPR